MRLYLIIIFLILLPTVYASNECDWGVGVVSNNIIDYNNNFSFTVRVFNFFGEKTNFTVVRSIEDIYGEIVREYKNITCEATRDKNCVSNKPDLSPGIYQIKVSIFPDCNDTELANNRDSKLIIILPEPLSQDYSKLKINEFIPDSVGDDDASMPDGEWVELYNPSKYSLDLENFSLYDNLGIEVDMFISNSNTMNKTIIDPYGYLVVYMNGRHGFLNNDGFEKISLYKDNYLIDEVSYSNSVEGLSWSRVSDKWILTSPTPNKENYIEEPDYSSYLDIDEVYLGNDNKAKFGDSLRVRIVVYKGDTTKYNLDIYIIDENNKQISKRSEINLEDTFTNYTLIVPIQIEPNCNKKYPDGTYKIILKGLDEIDSKEIEIEDITESLCEEIKVEEKTSSEKLSTFQDTKNLEFGNETSKESITSSIVYQSSDVKARNFGIYFFFLFYLLIFCLGFMPDVG